MTKFSDFIRAPGTAGPPTREGILALGFVLSAEVPGFLGKYVRVDAAQSFTSDEKTRGRANIGAIIGTDVQAFSVSLASLAGLTTAADRLAYTTASNTWAVTTLTAFGRSLIDDADAPAARATIGLGNVDNTSDANKPVSTATQTALDLKAPLASPALTGVPTVPTAAPGTNTVQAASTAFVTAAVAAADPPSLAFAVLTGSRLFGTVYQNTDPTPRVVTFQAASNGPVVDIGPTTGVIYRAILNGGAFAAQFIVPSGWYYKVTGTGVVYWLEGQIE